MTITLGVTVEEAILADLKTTIEGVTGGANWNTAVARVDVVDGDGVDQIEVPWAGIFHASTDASYQGRAAMGGGVPAGLAQKVALYYVALAMSSGGDDPASDIARYRDDVTAALHQTHTRGGNARDTHVIATEILTKTYQESHVQATLSVEVVFAHLFGDPTTPK